MDSFVRTTKSSLDKLVGVFLQNLQFQKISIPNHGQLPCFNPPLPSEIPKCITPPCPQNSIIVNPPPPPPPPSPSEFLFFFFWKYIFDLATALWTNKHEFMPPQGCNLGVPGDKLYSSVTRKTYHQWPGCANSFLSLNLAIKINTTYRNFTPLCFLVLFWRLQSKIAQIQTVKTFWRANTVKSSIFLRCVPFICHVVCTKSVLNQNVSCSVHECLKIWQASWKWEPSASFLLFIRREWQFASGKIHFILYLCDKKLSKVHANV